MHRLVRDALNTALQKLGFPWLTPHPTKTSHEIGYFQKAITPDDLYGMYKRNQMAHSIVFDVAYDALAAGYAREGLQYLLTYLLLLFLRPPLQPQNRDQDHEHHQQPQTQRREHGNRFCYCCRPLLHHESW
jgi:hypothetical protein